MRDAVDRRGTTVTQAVPVGVTLARARLMLVCAALAMSPRWAVASKMAAAPEGRALYDARCAVCHGTKGDGQGPAAYLLIPRPRDLTSGVYRFRSTPSGSLPVDADLTRVIRDGIRGTGMPRWGDELTEAQIASLLPVVKSFSPRFAKDKPAAPIEVPEPPAVTPELIAAGKAAYTETKCEVCHGAEGRGDGKSAPTLKDETGFKIRPADLTRPDLFKGGRSLSEVFRTFTSGIDGTPMPSFTDTIPVAKRWALAAYVLSLGSGRKDPPGKGEPIQPLVVTGDVPSDPLDAAWAAASERQIALRPLQSKPAAMDRIAVRVCMNAKEMAFLLSWADPTPDVEVAAVDTFRDGVAMQFPLEGVKAATPPSFTMGEATRPVYILHWKSDVQTAIARKASAHSGERAAGAAPAAAPGAAQGEVPAHTQSGAEGDAQGGAQDPAPGTPPGGVELAGATRPVLADVSYGLQNDSTFFTGLGAGNGISVPVPDSPVEELNAIGFGTLTAQPRKSQVAAGRGVYADGDWKVVIRRARRSPDAHHTSLSEKGTLPVAFAVWDGSRKDRNGQKLVSGWQSLVIP